MNWTVTLGNSAWSVPGWARPIVLILSLPAILVCLVAAVLLLPAVAVGAAVGDRVR